MNTAKNLISTVHSHINEHQLITPGSTIILGLSGGPDSLFLLHALSPLQATQQITLIAAHLDHEWRPDSYKDAEFCLSATQALGVRLVTAKISELRLSLKFNGSKEEWGRKARRYFFEQVADTYHAHHTALAHHADDQHETLFIRLIRGTSLSGLTGIKWKQGRYIRPLLGVYKQDILSYLHEHQIAYLTDPSNTSPHFLRNRIRAQVIPALRLCDARFDANMATTIKRLQETENFLDALTQQTYQTLRVEAVGFEAIDLAQFLALHPALQHRILIHWFCKVQVPFQPSQALLDEVMRFLKQPGNKEHQLYSGWGIRKKNGIASIVKESHL
ncbi:MAG: tRNA lysidine(34) synthetase TilS [Candidatus Babeliales bacterium]